MAVIGIMALIAARVVRIYYKRGDTVKGFPKWLNSKDDYIYVKDNFSKEQWADKFQSLLDDRLQWFNIGEITDDGITDENHKVVVSENMGETKKYQYELKENPSCLLYKLGFTVDEVENIIATIEVTT